MLLHTLLLAGCGTYMARGGALDWRDDRYYRSTQTSAQVLTGYDLEGYGRMITGGCWAMVVCPIAIIVTLPADALLDTVLLPYDAMQPERPKRNLNAKKQPPMPEDAPAATANYQGSPSLTEPHP
ncbi:MULTISPECIES: YceK/YidQ family lipoprotein [unclassified Pseudomonas]|uniref:YceK/YidQ family lipoprotein n=1 Tax=unclassified Pseudomonas TaxID=196821 RepID=UPI000A97A444|nr:MULTISPECIES: YceK/YidQ family lipoprotein [unclassified Pseudomonas]